MKPFCVPLRSLVSAGALLVAACSSRGQVVSTVFNDNFSSSTINQTETTTNVTPTSTSYSIASNKSATGSNIASGDLQFKFSTGSGYTEAEAQFTSSPISLSPTGVGTIEADMVFVPTSGILQKAGDYVFTGLFNSQGNVSTASPNVPYTNLTNGGIGSGTNDATGGVQNWIGYTGQLAATSGNGNIVFQRAAQTASTNVNQDLVVGPVGAACSLTAEGSSTTSTLVASSASTYTQDLLISVNADSSLTIKSTLYNGSGTGGSVVETSNATISAANVLTYTFDGLGFGTRAGTSPEQIDYSSVTVTDYTTPEPASLGLFGVGMIGLLRRRHRLLVGVATA